MSEKSRLPGITIYPAKHYLTAHDVREGAVRAIREELDDRMYELDELPRQRLESRNQLRHRDDTGGRVLLRNRELFPAL